MSAEAAFDLLSQIFEMTPEAPASDAEPSEVIEQCMAMVTSRGTPLAALRRILKNDPKVFANDARAADMVVQMRVREVEWNAAVQRAKQALRNRLAAVQRLRCSRRRSRQS